MHVLMFTPRPSQLLLLSFTTMRTAEDSMKKSTSYIENTRSPDTYVFSSPARDVGWSPSAASTPFSTAFYNNNPSTDFMSYVIESRMSPIRRNHHLSRPNTEPSLSSTLAPLLYQREANEPGVSLVDPESYSLSKGIHSSQAPPPSTPESVGKLFHNTSVQTDPSISLDHESEVYETHLPLMCSSSPISPPCHKTNSSPIKPKGISMFPPPASPPPFSLYPSSPTHTYTDLGSEHVADPIKPLTKRALRTGLLPSLSHCYPSAEPLDDDPFLVSVPKLTGGRPLGGVTRDFKSGSLDPRELLRHVPSFETGHASEEHTIDAEDAYNSSKRIRVPRKRVGAPSRTAITKRIAPGSTAEEHINQAFSVTSNPTTPLVSSPQFFSPQFIETEVDQASSCKNLSTPSTSTAENHPISLISYTNPSTTARTFFPAPRLTSSFDTPSTASILPTPAHTTLFPSPDIIDSPTIMHSIRGRGRTTRSRLASRYDMPSPMIKYDSIRDKNLPEFSYAHQVDQQNQEEVPYSKSWDDDEDDIQDREEASAFGGAGLQEKIGLLRAANPSSLKISSFSVPSSSDENEEVESLSPGSLGGQGQPVASSEHPNSTNSRSKRVHEDNGHDETASKRLKMPGKDKEATNRKVGSIVSLPEARLSHSNNGLNVGPKDNFRNDFGSGRATRSQSRAVAALLSLASSGDCQVTNQKQVAEATRKVRPNEVLRANIMVPRRTSSRIRGGSKPAEESHPESFKWPSQENSRNNHNVHGQAPNQAANVLSERTMDTNWSNDAPHIPLGATMAKRRSRKSQPHEARKEGESEEDHHVPTKHQVPADLLPRPNKLLVYRPDGEFIRRNFPEILPIHEGYPKWYRRFPVSAYFAEGDSVRKFVLGDRAVSGRAAMPSMPGLVPNSTAHFNLYNPRFVRGSGNGKLGVCPICAEPVWRGGAGKVVLLNTKISQYNYHMQNFHGLSPKTGLPFSPPIAFRQQSHRPSKSKAREKEVIEEGQCHVPEMFWWKHAASCHGTSQLAGDEDPYIEDSVYIRLREYESLSKNEGSIKEICSERQELKSESEWEVEEISGPSNSRTTPMEGAKDITEGVEDQEYSTDSDSNLTDLSAEDDIELSDY
ncbi:hypothetical protein RHS03_07066, partial [Rhizoctonia solani]